MVIFVLKALYPQVGLSLWELRTVTAFAENEKSLKLASALFYFSTK